MGKRVTEQWYACPAKTPTPRMTELCATCRFTTKSAPELMPEMVMPGEARAISAIMRRAIGLTAR